ncbi:30051_t:CDS:2, partial [Racocetra persica]
QNLCPETSETSEISEKHGDCRNSQKVHYDNNVSKLSSIDSNPFVRQTGGN